MSDKSGIWISYLQVSASGGRKTPGDATIRILIVDDHSVYRRSLRDTFELEPDIEVVGEAADGTQALELVGQLKPNIVLMDVNMPTMTGIEVTRSLTDMYPGILIILLTMFKGNEQFREARRAGASAYVMKDAGVDILLRTIRGVMSGETPLLQGDEQPIDASPHNPPTLLPPIKSVGTNYLITSNERTILKLLSEGCDNNQIAQHINAPESMVRTYLAEICRKLGLSGREAAAQYARQHLREL